MRVNVFLNSARRIAAERGLQPGGRAQMVLANELMRRSIKRTPKQDGYLNNSRRIINEGTALLYDMPYARYLWYGEVMAGKAPKYTTGRPLTYQDSPCGAKSGCCGQWRQKRQRYCRQWHRRQEAEQYGKHFRMCDFIFKGLCRRNRQNHRKHIYRHIGGRA